MSIEINGAGVITGVDSLSTPAVTNAAGSASAPSITFTGDVNTGLYSPGADQVAVTTGGTARLFVDSSGRLLVGTSTASSAAAQGTPQIQSAGDYQQSSILLRNTSNDNTNCALVLQKIRGSSIVQSGDFLGQVAFNGYDGAADRQGATITAIVDGTPGASDLPARLVFSTTADGASSPTERMWLTSEGQLRIGSRINLNPDQDASGSGNERSVGFFNGTGGSIIASNAFNQTGTITHIKFYNGNGAVGSVTTNGSATAYNTSSDYRLKENVVAVTDGITRLQKLKPSRFNFIADPDTAVDGFIAHEVQAVVPEAVTGSKDEVDADSKPVYQGIDQSKLVPLLTAALQEAIGRIETLEAEVTALKAS